MKKISYSKPIKELFDVEYKKQNIFTEKIEKMYDLNKICLVGESVYPPQSITENNKNKTIFFLWKTDKMNEKEESKFKEFLATYYEEDNPDILKGINLDYKKLGIPFRIFDEVEIYNSNIFEIKNSNKTTHEIVSIFCYYDYELDKLNTYLVLKNKNNNNIKGFDFNKYFSSSNNKNIEEVKNKIKIDGYVLFNLDTESALSGIYLNNLSFTPPSDKIEYCKSINFLDESFDFEIFYAKNLNIANASSIGDGYLTDNYTIVNNSFIKNLLNSTKEKVYDFFTRNIDIECMDMELKNINEFELEVEVIQDNEETLKINYKINNKNETIFERAIVLSDFLYNNSIDELLLKSANIICKKASIRKGNSNLIKSVNFPIFYEINKYIFKDINVPSNHYIANYFDKNNFYNLTDKEIYQKNELENLKNTPNSNLFILYFDYDNNKECDKNDIPIPKFRIFSNKYQFINPNDLIENITKKKFIDLECNCNINNEEKTKLKNTLIEALFGIKSLSNDILYPYTRFENTMNNSSLVLFDEFLYNSIILDYDHIKDEMKIYYVLEYIALYPDPIKIRFKRKNIKNRTFEFSSFEPFAKDSINTRLTSSDRIIPPGQYDLWSDVINKIKDPDFINNASPEKYFDFEKGTLFFESSEFSKVKEYNDKMKKEIKNGNYGLDKTLPKYL